MSAARALHPERLPWFAAGRLDGAEAAVIERHVRGCALCRGEVEALRSVYRSLREEAGSSHVSPVHLVAFHTHDPELPDHERRIVGEHLGNCRTCSLDLEALARADASPRRKHGRRILAAAASVLIVVAVGWQLASRRAPPPSMAAITRVVFQPAQRGTGAEQLTGAGPWEFEIWLPLRASAPAYRARIYRGDDRSSAILGTTVAPGPHGAAIVWLVPRGVLRPGHYALALSPDGDGGPGTDIRGFDVEGSP